MGWPWEIIRTACKEGTSVFLSSTTPSFLLWVAVKYGERAGEEEGWTQKRFKRGFQVCAESRWIYPIWLVQIVSIRTGTVNRITPYRRPSFLLEIDPVLRLQMTKVTELLSLVWVPLISTVINNCGCTLRTTSSNHLHTSSVSPWQTN